MITSPEESPQGEEPQISEQDRRTLCMLVIWLPMLFTGICTVLIGIALQLLGFTNSWGSNIALFLIDIVLFLIFAYIGFIYWNSREEVQELKRKIEEFERRFPKQ